MFKSRRSLLLFAPGLLVGAPGAASAQDEHVPVHNLRVVGGTPQAVPYQVLLHVPRVCVNDDGGYIPSTAQTYLCGGSLIAPQTVLTAAHCIANHDLIFNCVSEYDVTQSIQASIGGVDRFDFGASHVAHTVNATPPVSHSDYDPLAPNPDHDIAIIELREPLSTTENSIIQLSSEPDADVTLSGNLFVSGYGRHRQRTPNMGAGMPLSQPGLTDDAGVLMGAHIPYVPLGDCIASLAAVGSVHGFSAPSLTQRQLCAGFDEIGAGIADSCQGDSGGPLVAFGPDRRPYQVGIVSYGFGCAWPGSYGIYTNVGMYTDWIAEHAPEAQFIGRATSPNDAAGASPEDGSVEGVALTAPELVDAVLAALEERGAESAMLDVTPSTELALEEAFAIELTSPIAGEVTIFEIGPDRDGVRDVVQLYPGAAVLANELPTAIEAGQSVRVPSGLGFEGFDAFEAGEPTGVYTLVAVISPSDRTPDRQTRSEDVIAEDGRIEDPVRYLMNLRFQIEREDAAGAPAQWAYASHDYRIVD